MKYKKMINNINSSRLLLLSIISLTLVASSFLDLDSFAQSEEPALDRNTKLNLAPYSDDQNLSLSTIGLVSNPTFTINGQTGNTSEGYYTYTTFNGEYLLLTTGLINKTSQDQIRGEPQFTINFNVLGENDNYTLSFIDGRISDEGWIENTFFQSIDPNTTKLINLPELIQMNDDAYKAIDKITVTLEKDTIVKPASFNINLIRTSIP